MNFEEIVHNKEIAAARLDRLPFGRLVKKQVGRKFVFVVEADAAITATDSLQRGLEADCDIVCRLRLRQQLHYELRAADGGALELELDPGSYQTFAQVLSLNPAIVAKSGFIDKVASELFAALEQLHAQQVFHLCLSPCNVLLRKGDEMPMLLVHGSSFGQTPALLSLFSDDDRRFIAPEVLAGEPTGERSDIYSLGRFLESLFEQGSVSIEYKKIIARATQEDPAKRYAHVADMRAALEKIRSTKRSLLGLVAAAALSLGVLGVYIEMLPEAEDIEFIDAAPKEAYEDVYDQPFSPIDSVELAVLGDSGEIDTITVEQRKALEIYMKKSEEIYRKQFENEADKALSKIYNSESMNASEKKFRATSSAVRDELLQVQQKLAEEAGISDDVAGRISTEIIDKLTIEKQKKLKTLNTEIKKDEK